MKKYSKTKKVFSFAEPTNKGDMNARLKANRMNTFLFNEIVFGPVHSRRLGISLGINLLPVNKKICNFNCIYCECGLTYDEAQMQPRIPSEEQVYQALEIYFINHKKQKQRLDVITFAGNGEPTIHPDFAKILNNTIALRNKYVPEVKIAVLSNGATIHKPDVFTSLNKIEFNIQKLDSAIESTIELINRPHNSFDFDAYIDALKRFKGNVIIQTLFLRGKYNNCSVNNMTEREVNAWLQLLKEIKPKLVMIYSIARRTPYQDLKTIPVDELQGIAKKMKQQGLKVQVTA